MKVTIEQDVKYKDPEILVRCETIDDTLHDIISYIGIAGKSVLGEQQGETTFIPVKDVYYFESVDNKVFIYTGNQVYKSSAKLYILEEQLSGTYFTRISKTTILNLKIMKSVRSGRNYTLEATLANGEKVLISRHYVKKVKEKLGV